ncbi:MAG: hypothetical protein AAF754_15790 [Pseudomonadota bacterium]|mgnify:CR=1 FL=1
MRFVANLRDETINAFLAGGIQPRAYLLSSHRVTPSTLESAARVRDLGLPVFADNGTKELIDATLDLFDPDAKPIRDEVRDIRREIGHTPRGSEVPDSLRAKAKSLAKAVVAHATVTSDAIDAEELLVTQLSMDPTDLIAQEDFATACVMGLGLEREITGFSVNQLRSRNKRSLRLWQTVANDPRCQDIRVHAVLSAMDFNTAQAAGRLAAQADIRFAALGIAGINRDSSATDFFVINKASRRLDRPAPRRYVRLTQILRGLEIGMAQTGHALTSFHCLGLGATAMLPIPAACFGGSVGLTTDATSPIHDAIRDQVYYEFENRGARVSTSAIANRTVQDEPWAFSSPFEQDFRDEFGHDADAAKEWWVAHEMPQIDRTHLQTEPELNDALPLLGEIETDLRRRGERVRVASNHWTIGELAAVYQPSDDRPGLAYEALTALSVGSGTVVARGAEAAINILEASGFHR